LAIAFCALMAVNLTGPGEAGAPAEQPPHPVAAAGDQTGDLTQPRQPRFPDAALLPLAVGLRSNGTASGESGRKLLG
jgi:hypothetical protein